MKKIYLTKLSGVQIKQLCTLAGQAFKAAKSREGAVDDDVTADAFRKAGQLEAVGKESLKECHQGDYLEIVGKWFTVIGDLEAAFYAFMNAGPQNEFKRQMAWRLMGQIYGLAQAMERRENMRPEVPISSQAWLYAQSISKDRFKGRQITSLDGFELEQLGFTIVNRTNAMRGVGSAGGRNKKQGAKRPVLKDTEKAFERPLTGGESSPSCAGLSAPETLREDSRGGSHLLNEFPRA